MRLVITGANSFVAQSIIKKCNELELDWVGLDITKNTNPKIIECDIQSQDIVKHLRSGDCILHLAAISSDGLAKANINSCYDVNVSGTINIFNRAIEAGAKKFIFASSEWVYGDNCEKLLTEDYIPSLFDLKSDYAKSKLLSEIILNSRVNTGVELIILRFGILFGKRDKNLSAFESIVKSCIESNEVVIGSKATARRFIDVEEVANYIVKNYSNIKCGTYNMASKQLISLQDIIETVGALLNKNINIKELNPESYSIRNIFSKYSFMQSLESSGLEEKVNNILQYHLNNE